MSRAPVLHQETRLSTSSVSPSQILNINTSPSAPHSSFGAGRKRGFDEISGLDEQSYARKYLATEASVFFRSKHKSPRSLLWRVLDEGKALEVQSVDIVHDGRQSKSGGGTGSGLSFRVQLADAILKNGVAFADLEDGVEVFVFSTKGELYTITLKRDLLARETVPGDFDPASVVRKYVSSTVQYRHAYRLVAVSSLELLVSLHDGSVLQLTRQAGENGAQWRESLYAEGNWSDTIRGLISFKRHQTVRYGDFDLDSSTAAEISRSPDGKYIWTISLDHELRAWSTQTGKSIWHRDMLNQRFTEEQRKQQRYVMSAEPGTLMQLVTLPTHTSPSTKRGSKVEAEDGIYYIVVRSPKDNQFKFYQVSSAQPGSDEEKFAINDVQPAAKLIPPIDELMDTSMWHLEDFAILPGLKWQGSQLLVRARNGKICRTFCLTFSLLDRKGEPADLEHRWQTAWTSVDTGLQTTEALQSYSDFPGDLETFTDSIATLPTERWLEFLFYPGRFSIAEIETALSVYKKGRSLPVKSNAGRKGLTPNAPEAPLKERLSQAITSKILLKRSGPNEQPDYEKYQASIQTEWKTFYSLLRDLHARRNESIALSLDPYEGLAWSVYADLVAPLRGASSFEALVDNEHLLKDEEDALGSVDEEVQAQTFASEEAVSYAHVLVAAREFSSRLPAEFKARFKDFVILSTVGHQGGDREANEQAVQGLYERLEFSKEVMDDDFQALESSAQNFGGLGALTDEMILGVLELMDEEANAGGKDSDQELSRYGNKLIVAGAQETLERNRRVLLELLAMVVFMFSDLERSELHPQFVEEVGPVYDAIVTRLKHNEMLSWLARNEIAEHDSRQAKDPLVSTSSSSLEAQKEGEVNVSAMTLFERISIPDWDSLTRPEDTMPDLLTKWSKQLLSGSKLWSEWDGMTGYIMGFLIKAHQYELAIEFQRFLSQAEDTAGWLRYLEGRLLLATGEYAEASLKFHAAAPDMAEAKNVGGTDGANLLSPDEQNYFGVGQSRFYQHILDLFDKLRIFSYAADFARISLEHLESGNDEFGRSLAEIDKRKALLDSPQASRIDDTRSEISILSQVNARRNELRMRLFTALVETGRFREAYEALVGIEDKGLKRAELGKLIKACIDRDAVDTLLALPLKDGDMVREADATLLALAKKSLASGSSSTGIPYHHILYAFRTQRGDFRGAAEILYQHLERVRYTQHKHGFVDPEEETLVNAYVLLINTLACCGDGEGWFLAEPLEVEGVNGADGHGKRKLVTIADVRKAYASELDRRSDVMHGRFPLVGGGGEMEIDVL